MNENMDEKLRDLLCDQAVFGLTDEEAKQLEELSSSGDQDAQKHRQHHMPFVGPEVLQQPLHQLCIVCFTEYFFFLRHRA